MTIRRHSGHPAGVPRKTRITRITIETHRRTVIRNSDAPTGGDTRVPGEFAKDPPRKNSDPVEFRPAKGTVILSWRTMTLSPIPAAGGAIADVARNNYIEVRIEILQPDGTPVGSLMALGLGAGTPPPGAPPDTVQGNNAIIGGTGAF